MPKIGHFIWRQFHVLISYHIYFHSMNPYRITKIHMDMEKVKFA